MHRLRVNCIPIYLRVWNTVLVPTLPSTTGNLDMGDNAILFYKKDTI